MVGLLSFVSTIASSFGEWMVALVANIPKFLYFLITSVLSVLDIFQYLFRRLAGLDVYYIDGVEQEGDIIYGFLTGIITGKYPTLQTIFWSLIVLGVILLILSAILAVIKSEFKEDEKDPQGKFKAGNKKGKIVKSIIKGVFIMAIVPVTSIFGIYLSNVVLRAVDTATTAAVSESILSSYTFKDENSSVKSVFKENENGSYSNYNLFGIISPSKYTTFSGMVFRVCVYDANRARSDADFITTVILPSESSTEYTGNFGVFNLPSSDDKIAELIDAAFANNAELNNQYRGYKIDIEKGISPEYMVRGWDFFSSSYDNEITHFSNFNIGLVSYYYNLWQFNWVVGILFCYFIAKFYIGITFGLIRRIITFVTLFLVSPIFAGTLPLKDLSKGSIGDLTKNAISVIGTVGAVNVFMSLLPFFEEITFFPSGTGFDLINNIVQLVFVVAGFVMINEIIKTINGYIGGASIDGTDLAQGVAGSFGKAFKGVTSIGTGSYHAITGASNLARAGIGALGSTQRKEKKEIKREGRDAKSRLNNLRSQHNAERTYYLNTQQEANEIQRQQDFKRESDARVQNAYNVYKTHGGTDTFDAWSLGAGNRYVTEENQKVIDYNAKAKERKDAEFKEFKQEHAKERQSLVKQHHANQEYIKNKYKSKRDKVAKNMKKFNEHNTKFNSTFLGEIVGSVKAPFKKKD